MTKLLFTLLLLIPLPKSAFSSELSWGPPPRILAEKTEEVFLVSPELEGRYSTQIHYDGKIWRVFRSSLTNQITRIRIGRLTPKMVQTISTQLRRGIYSNSPSNSTLVDTTPDAPFCPDQPEILFLAHINPGNPKPFFRIEGCHFFHLPHTWREVASIVDLLDALERQADIKI